MNEPSRIPLLSRRKLVSAVAASALASGSHLGRAAGMPTDWAEADPASQGFAAGALESVLAEGAAVPGLRSLLVARNGRLVGERYYAGANAGQLLALNSATKSVCSMLVGRSLQQGKLRDLSQTVQELLPEPFAQAPASPARSLSLRQILTGTTGLAYDFTTGMMPLLRAGDPVQHVLALPADGKPAGSWSYNDAAISLLGPILERAWGQPLEDIARTELFTPLGIDSFKWLHDGAGRAMTYHGLMLKTRDLLKIAWTMTDGGAWAGRQVIAPDWVAQSTRPATEGAWSTQQMTGSRYAFLWFTGMLAGQPIAWAWGYGGQFAVLVPQQRLALATAATSPPPRDLSKQTNAVMALAEKVLRAAS